MKKIELDELGTEVWDLLDGRRSVRHLIKSFAGTHQLEPREAEVSVTQFIRELGRRGLGSIQPHFVALRRRHVALSIIKILIGL